MSKTQFRPKVEKEPYNSKLTKCHICIKNVITERMTPFGGEG